MITAQPPVELEALYAKVEAGEALTHEELRKLSYWSEVQNQKHGDFNPGPMEEVDQLDDDTE